MSEYSEYKDCAKHRDCSYRIDVGLCPLICLQYRHVDDVRVVRCADCKFWTEGRHHTGKCKALIDFHDAERYVTDAAHFCSYGERKDNG